MKKIVILLFLLSNLSYSMDWKSNGNFSTLLNEMLYSNWAKGGENQLSIIALFNYQIRYDSPDTNLIWENIATTGYGFQTSENYSFRKNEDKIELSTKLGYRAFNKNYYSFNVVFRTQFDKGFAYPNDRDVVSKFFAPAYLIANLGLDFKPFNDLSVTLSPLSGRTTFVEDQELANKGSFGVRPAKYDSAGVLLVKGENIRFDFGIATTINYTFVPMENVKVQTKLDLFNNYTDPDLANRKNIDINSETSIFFKVNDYISANLFMHFIYDQDTPILIFQDIDGKKTQIGTGPRLQIKHNLGIGFSYAL